MKKKILLTFILICIAILAAGAIGVSAEKYGDLTYKVYSDHVEITDCDTSAKEVDIPSEIEGLPVTSVAWFAFYGCDSLTSVTIPDSVASIGISAFYGCSGLTSITIPDSVVSIGDRAFIACKSLASVTIPDSVTSIGNGVFSGCKSLATVIIPDSVTSIGNYEFNGCSALTSITIPNSVNSIGNRAFKGCDSLSAVYFSGTDDDWNKIIISGGNGELANAKRVRIYKITLADAEDNKKSVSCHPGETADISAIKSKYIYKISLYTDPEMTKSFDESTPINSDLTLYVKYESTNVSEDGKTFTVSALNTEPGKTVILALYKNGMLVDMLNAKFNGEELTFTTDEEYTSAKVMVWNDLASLKPICTPETIR